MAETNHYYPFGGFFASTSVQPYKYNGKELDTKKGLNWYDYGARNYDAALCRWQVVDPLAEKYYAWSPYNYCLNNPMNLIDPDGKDGIYITYPDYKINVGGLKIPNLGHAGILLIDNVTGFTKYYEYGRYDEESRGVVRTVSVPNVEIGINGKPTETSLNKVLKILSEKTGQNGRIEGAYIESDKFDDMKNYAETKMAENSNPDREKYSLTRNNCGTFASDVLNQDKNVKEKLPVYLLPTPNNIVKKYQEVFPRISFDKTKSK